VGQSGLVLFHTNGWEGGSFSGSQDPNGDFLLGLKQLLGDIVMYSDDTIGLESTLPHKSFTLTGLSFLIAPYSGKFLLQLGLVYTRNMSHSKK
jgi:hypothetical protein